MIFLYLIDNEEDRSYLERIYNAHHQQMYYLAYSITSNVADAEDVVHDIFRNVAENKLSDIKNITNKTALKNYLLKATKHTAINNIKSRENTHLHYDSLDDSDADIPELSDDSFFDTILVHLEYDRVIAAMRSLDKKYFKVLYSHYAEEKSIPEVAKLLDQSVDTTKKQLVRGKKLLLSRLEQED